MGRRRIFYRAGAADVLCNVTMLPALFQLSHHPGCRRLSTGALATPPPLSDWMRADRTKPPGVTSPGLQTQLIFRV